MIRPLLVVLVLASPSASGLTLIGDADAENLRVRVDEGNLSAKRLAGQPTINGSPAPEARQPLDVASQSWRGFENVTHLAANGTGRLLLADAASGLVVNLDENATRTSGNESTADEEPGPSDRSDRENETEPPSNSEQPDPGTPNSNRSHNASADAARPGTDHPVHDDRLQRSPASSNPRPETSDTSPDEAGSSTVSTVAPLAVLGLLAAGAFAVERSRDSDEDEPPRLDP